MLNNSIFNITDQEKRYNWAHTENYDRIIDENLRASSVILTCSLKILSPNLCAGSKFWRRFLK